MSTTAQPVTLPVIDLRGLETGANARGLRLAELRQAAREVGFFYLAEHGVSASQNDGLLAMARRFFALPEADKRAVDMIHSPHFRGYTSVGKEITRGRPDWREQFDIGAERACPWRPGSRPGCACRVQINGLTPCRSCGRRCSPGRAR